MLTIHVMKWAIFHFAISTLCIIINSLVCWSLAGGHPMTTSAPATASPSPLRWDEAVLNMIKFANSVEVSHKKLASFPCKLFNAYVNFLCKIWIVPQNITCGDKIIRPLAKCFALHCRAILFNSAQLVTIKQDRQQELETSTSTIKPDPLSTFFISVFMLLLFTK